MRHKGFRLDDERGGKHKGKSGHHDSSWSGDERPGRGRTRAQRGDVRTAVLLIVAEKPQHGYQIMQAMTQRSGGAWRPSPGAVYPTISQLEHEGLVSVADEGGRRMVTITAEGLDDLRTRTRQRGDPFLDFVEEAASAQLVEPVQALASAALQVEATGTPDQVEAALGVLANARRALYLILAGEGGVDGR